MSVSVDLIPDLSRLIQPTNSTVQSTSTSNGHNYALINTDELVNIISKICDEKIKLRQSIANKSKQLSRLEDKLSETELRLNDEMLRSIELERQVQELRSRVPVHDEIPGEYRVITFLRKYELLFDSISTLATAGACFFFPLYAIPIMLANGACITFVHFLVKK